MVRDSAGVRIVENRPDERSLDTLDLTDAAATSFGAAVDGDLTFHRIAGVLPWHDGVVVGEESGAISWLDADGDVVQRVAPGEGPGESTYIVWLQPLSTGIAVYDPGLRRITELDDEGRPLGIREVPFDEIDRVADVSFHGPGAAVGVLEGRGTVAFGMAGPLFEGTEGMRPVRAVLALLPVDGGVPAEIDTTSVFSVLELHPDGTGLPYTLSPLHPPASFVVRAGRVHWTSVSDRRVEVRDLADASALSIRLPGARRPITEGDAARYWQWTGAEIDPTERPLPDSLPASGAMAVADDGSIWLQEPTFPWEERNPWWIFSANGRLERVALLPENYRVFAATEARIYGKRTDELGIESVLVVEREAAGR